MSSTCESKFFAAIVMSMSSPDYLSTHSLLLSQRMNRESSPVFPMEEKQIVSNHEAHAKTCVLYQTVYGTCDSNYNEPNSETEQPHSNFTLKILEGHQKGKKRREEDRTEEIERRRRRIQDLKNPLIEKWRKT